MRDFYPDDMHARLAIFSAWENAARRHAFLQYDSCVVESLDLLKRKGGEEIGEQLYTFKDKSDRDLALRAEMTPTLARMVAARQSALPLPLKWFAIAQCFRYERTTKGRKREHYQWNLDVLGEDAMTAEAEVLATAADALSILGLGHKDVTIRLNSRALMADLFLKAGIDSAHHQTVFLGLDKRGKETDEQIAGILKAGGLDSRAVSAAFDLMRIASLEDALQMLGSETPAYARLRELMGLLGNYGLGDMIAFDISVVRGLGYYTGAVFEAYDSQRKFRALFGGGRYDNLLTSIGGAPMSGVGLGFGDVVITELMNDLGLKFQPPTTKTVAIGFMEDAQQQVAIAVAQSLRRAGRQVDMSLRSQKPKQFFSRAGNAGYAEAVFIGPDDVAGGSIRCKDLATRTERVIQLAQILQ